MRVIPSVCLPHQHVHGGECVHPECLYTGSYMAGKGHCGGCDDPVVPVPLTESSNRGYSNELAVVCNIWLCLLSLLRDGDSDFFDHDRCLRIICGSVQEVEKISIVGSRNATIDIIRLLLLPDEGIIEDISVHTTTGVLLRK